MSEKKITAHTRAEPMPNDDITDPRTAAFARPEITEPQRILAEAVEHLQGRQKEVYLLTFRLKKSLNETAIILGISKGAAQKHQDRAIRFLRGYCEQTITKQGNDE